MPTNRIQKLACTITAGIAVFVALAVQAGSTTAAALTSSASASGAARGKVHIELTGTVLGARGNKGRFTLSGALSDRGRFVDLPGLANLWTLYNLRTLYGAKGTIRIIVGQQASWSITKGTKAYAGLHGRGKVWGLYVRNSHIMMTGTVWP